MRTSVTLLISGLLLATACKREELTPCEPAVQGEVLQQRTDAQAVPQGGAMSQADVDRTVLDMLRQRDGFDWNMVDLRTRWSATQYNEQHVAIGYQPAHLNDLDDMIHEVDIHKNEWRAVHDAIIQLVLTTLNANRTTALRWEDILIEDDQELPIITLRAIDAELFTALYNLKNVRYIEPLGYWPAIGGAERSTSGCGAGSTALNAADISTITPNARLPWNFNNHNIPAAWNSGQGQGITIGVIDAGISSAQPLIGSGFNNGDSDVGRTLTTGYTFGGSTYSTCTHGTSMSGLAAGPRNDQGATTGVGYKSNLRFIRGCEDVVLDLSSELTGVKNALVQMGDDNTVRVVSMSIGTPFSSSVLSDGVNYAYGRGKMLMAAAGTSFNWLSWWGVIYPAALTKCVAVTGVKENGGKCSSCHDGSQVDLTICMERNASSSRNSVSLSPSGNAPAYIGGSSAATSTAAGIAAVVWGVRPTATRDQILQCLKSTAQFAAAPSSNKGYGNINAAAAVNCALAL
ncbi:MAG: S8/S53 family peptidase [Flavobacteriales bacterium]|nr:S8/S53 family peptidase [Flavobacteriales bacterium]